MTGRWALGGLLIALVVAYTAPIAGLVLMALVAVVALYWRPRTADGVTGASGDSRLDLLESRLVSLELEVAELRAQAGTLTLPRQPARPAPPRRPRPSRTRGPRPCQAAAPAAAPRSAAAPGTAHSASEASPRGRPLEAPRAPSVSPQRAASSPCSGRLLLRARGEPRLDQPRASASLGAAASVGVFSAGFWLRRRFGTTYAALAAVGAGIAGAYATLLAATAMYGFVPEAWALVAAAGIAGAATAVALRWKAELVAALGLIGALLVPLMTLVEDGDFTRIGTAFAAVVFAATAVVALKERWGTCSSPGSSPRSPRPPGSCSRATRRSGSWSGSPPCTAPSTSQSRRSCSSSPRPGSTR